VELRHLRYFVAVAEARSLKLAAERKLHTTQPSLSRQIRDLEAEVGIPLFVRGARGVELTPAGRVFLDHARVMLSQAETAVQSARRIAHPVKPLFSLGFMIGHDSTWVPAALHVLREELPHLQAVISTQNSPQLADALQLGIIDVAFLRKEDGGPALDFKLLVEEPLEVFLPAHHPLADGAAIRVEEIVGETFLSISGTALGASGKPPALRRAIDRYLEENAIDLRPSHEVDNLGGMMSLITSTGGIALLPVYAKTFLPDSVTTRPILGPTPKIDLSLGFRKGNRSPILERLLSTVDELRSLAAGSPLASLRPSTPLSPAVDPASMRSLRR
jgi:LysR family hca operon transcriptional activator